MGCGQSRRPESSSLPKTLGWKDLTEFVPPINSGRVIKVYDGDSITIASKVPGLEGNKIYRFSVRLKGIDAPELRGSGLEEKEMAKKSKQALSDKILHTDVFLKNIENDKYGRLLCEVYLKKENISQWMLSNRYAVAYDGKKKLVLKSWKAYFEENRL